MIHQPDSEKPVKGISVGDVRQRFRQSVRKFLGLRDGKDFVGFVIVDDTLHGDYSLL